MALLACSGCELIANVPNAVRSTADGAINDADVDAEVDALPIDALPCYGAFDPICMILPDDNITLPTEIDTGTSPLCVSLDDPAGIAGSLCLIAGKTITSVGGAPTTITGPRPLALVASQEITIGGSLDVHNSSDVGCNRTNPTKFAGGAGGARGGNGGNGGDSGDNGNGGVSDPAKPASLTPGCSGGKGAGSGAGDGGAPGGSLLLASLSINIIPGALINANGLLGRGGGNAGGGGGGGSGGVIIVDAPVTKISGTLLAAGGGGGEGGNGGVFNGTVGSGNNGQTLNPSSPANPANGGNGRPGGDGGQGGHLADKNGAAGQKDGVNQQIGGGGGGGAGIILVPSTTAMITGTVIPAPQQQ